MVATNLIRQEDWTALLRLAGEVSELPPIQSLRRKHILSGLIRLLNASGGAVFDMMPPVPRTTIARPGTMLGVGLSSFQLQQIEDYLTSDDDLDDASENCGSKTLQELGTATRRQMIDDDSWYRSDNYNRLMRPWGFEDRIHSLVRHRDGNVTSVALVRGPGEEPFSERDVQVLGLFHSHAGSLYAAPESPRTQAAKTLPPRLRPILTHLLQGDAEKQVAHKLELSQHTIHAYVKEIYRRFEVSSRGELLARFVM